MSKVFYSVLLYRAVFFSLVFLVSFFVFEMIFVDFSLIVFLPEVLLLLLIIVGFFYFLSFGSSFKAVLAYLVYIACAFVTYLCLALFIYFYCAFEYLGFNFSLFYTGGSSFAARSLVLFCIGCLWLLLYTDILINRLYIIELPFLFALLMWGFIMASFIFNFIFLFVLMEFITLLIVVLSCLYFIILGLNGVRFILQFFVINLLVSTIFLLGINFLLFLVPTQSGLTIAYSTVWINFWVLLGGVGDYVSVLLYLKLCLMLVLICLVFKLTLAPFSVWVVQVYNNLPLILLVLLMTLYKLAYLFIFVRIFVTVLNLIPILGVFCSQALLFFIVPSLFIGCFALRATALKEILAYTTVSQLGYVFLGVVAATPITLKYSFLYLVFYAIQIFGVGTILMFLQRVVQINRIQQLAVIKHINAFYYYALVLIFFSLCGVPPLGGFFVKYFLFLEIYQAGYFGLAFVSLLSGYFMSLIYLNLAIALISSLIFQDYFSFNSGVHTIFTKLEERIFIKAKIFSYIFLFVLLGMLIFFMLGLPIMNNMLGNFIVQYCYLLA